MPRDDFPNKVKVALSRRAGFLCSICNILTVGPSDEGDLSVNSTGVAAHIAAASGGIGSRRYDPSMTPEERSSIQNGIWLCTRDADLIDGDETTFTTQYLKLIKKNHEEKVKLKQSGIGVEKGIITKVEISNSGKISKLITLKFTDRNIIVGQNGTGKTLICEFISALTDKEYLNRWITESHKSNSFFSIYFFRNQQDKFTISISNKNKISYTLNGSPIPILIPPINIFYIKEDYWRFVNKIPDEIKENLSLIDLLAQYFNLKTLEFINVINSIVQDKKYFVNDLFLNSSDNNLIIKFEESIGSPGFPFLMLSSGEQERVILEIALKIASYYAKYTSTILIIEKTSFGIIDPAGINDLLNLIRKENFNFQFFFTTFYNKHYDVTDYEINNLIEIKGKGITVVKNYSLK